MIRTIRTLKGHHCVIEYRPYDPARTPEMPTRKTLATKNFARWLEGWIDKKQDGKFQKLRVREQFQVGNFTELKAGDILNLERLENMCPQH